MNIPFILINNVIRVPQYVLKINNNIYRYFITKEEAEKSIKELNNKNSFSLEKIDSTNLMWLDGIVVEEDGNVYAKAMDIYNMGEIAYKEKINKPTIEQELAQTKADNLAFAEALAELQYKNDIKDLGGTI